MKRTVGAAGLAVLLSCISGCGSDEKVTGDSASLDREGWQTLLTGSWTIPGGSESYTCVRQTIQEDLFVSAFEAIIPKGTHHTLLTMGDPDGKPDGLFPCTASTNRMKSAFGSGVGTDPIHFPPGIAMKIAKGTQLLLNLHLFNTGKADLSGTSGTRIQTMPESDVKEVAEGVLAGTVALQIPAGETTTHKGSCTWSNDSTVFAVAPHMHQLGIHEKVVAESSTDGSVVLLDDAYSFDEQSYRLIPPVHFAKGDKVNVECTHHNTTGKTVGFGESSRSEMCFAGLYRYPADGSIFICVR